MIQIQFYIVHSIPRNIFVPHYVKYFCKLLGDASFYKIRYCDTDILYI